MNGWEKVTRCEGRQRCGGVCVKRVCKVGGGSVRGSGIEPIESIMNHIEESWYNFPNCSGGGLGNARMQPSVFHAFILSLFSEYQYSYCPFFLSISWKCHSLAHSFLQYHIVRIIHCIFTSSMVHQQPLVFFLTTHLLFFCLFRPVLS